ncbi:MAG: hypothetical protein HYU74_13145 [Dechloromonas sp.]|nr:hypothetical protein [Dechloromonas sp.]
MAALRATGFLDAERRRLRQRHPGRRPGHPVRGGGAGDARGQPGRPPGRAGYAARLGLQSVFVEPAYPDHRPGPGRPVDLALSRRLPARPYRRRLGPFLRRRHRAHRHLGRFRSLAGFRRRTGRRRLCPRDHHRRHRRQAAHGDPTFAEFCRGEGARLRLSLEEHGWDGAWYRRAYFDDGTPLGSASNAECRIDSISQSWAVLSGAGDAQRSQIAMKALDERLVRRQDGLVQLLDPPFSKSLLDPGYIRGYVPGVRENGGQYTHGAIWAAMAFAELGDRARAWELLAMINPVNHGLTADDVTRYKVEPYVVTADVYAVPPHIGRGGWSWYTGSAGWMYRLIVESLLGLRREGETLHFKPCLPADWPSIGIRYRFHETDYRIDVTQTGAGSAPQGAPFGVVVDGVRQEAIAVQLIDDRQEHLVQVTVACL